MQATRLAEIGCHFFLAKCPAAKPQYGHTVLLSTFFGRNPAKQRPHIAPLRFIMLYTHARSRWAIRSCEDLQHGRSTYYTRPYCHFIALYATYLHLHTTEDVTSLPELSVPAIDVVTAATQQYNSILDQFHPYILLFIDRVVFCDDPSTPREHFGAVSC